MKKILFTLLNAALLMSCSSNKAAMANQALAEAKTLQNLAKNRGVEVSATTNDLIIEAEKQKKDVPETTLILADEATLQLQIALLKQENKNMADSLEIAAGSLTIIRNLLETHKNANTQK